MLVSEPVWDHFHLIMDKIAVCYNQKKRSHPSETSGLTNLALCANLTGKRLLVFSTGADFAGL